MKKAALCILFMGFIGAGQVTNAHELATHGALTSHAYQRSTLSTESTRLRDLGLDPANANPFGGVYYDVSGGQVRERLANDNFEGTIIEDLGVTPFSVPGWLMRGAIREDDLGFVFGSPVGGDPHDDPYGPFWRVMHHFYDPARNLPLTLSQSSTFLFQQATGESADFRRAPDWAVGSRDAFVQLNTPEANRRNHFTIFDAREAMYRALTGRDSRGNPLQAVAGGALTKQSDIRNAYWATTFRALGDVLHLNQEMAQPQHTRNDTHAGTPGFGHESIFEKYIEARATGAQSYQIDGTQVTPQPLNYGGYPIPAFTRYSDFWSTREASGRGLADYSNRGFFSAGTNLGSNSYTSPSNDAASYAKESVAGLLPATPSQKLNFLRGDAPDTLNVGSSANIRMTTESVFDLFLVTTPSTYSLNRFNYDDMANLLIPRAVAYSAGLVNYFFRGKLDAEPDGASGFTVRNTSREAMQGNFALYSDDSQGNRTKVSLTRCRAGGADAAPDDGMCKGVALASANTDAGARLTIGFTPPSGPKPKAYMLVFSGDMGEERAENGMIGAVVGRLIEPPFEGFLVTPSYAPADGFGGIRLIERTDGQWELKQQTGLVIGNVDWKGWYVNGKPTQALSWRGFRNRYYKQPGTRSPFTPEIYYQGNLFALAPGPVLGAAMAKDPAGNVWLVAVVGEEFSGRDEVYRRPFRASTSSALFHPQTAPDGWQLIATYVPAFMRQDAWFFNGAGTEAQRLVAHPFMRSAKLSLTLNADGSAQGTVVNVAPAPGGLETTQTVPWDQPPTPTGAFCNVGTNSEAVAEGVSVQGSTDLTVTERPSGLTRVLGVDYLDGQEIVAELKTFAVRTTGMYSWQHVTTRSVCRVGCEGFNAFDRLPTRFTERARTLDEGRTARRIVMGSTTIEIPSFGRLDSLSEFTIVSETRVCSEPKGFVTVSQNSSSSSTTTSESNYFYVAFMDLRESLAAVYRHNVKRVNQQPPEHEEVVDVHSKSGKQTHVLARLTGSPPGCPAASDCDTGPAELESGAFDPSWYDVGYASDLAGNQAYSLRIVSRVIAPLNRNNIFNSLTGGSLPQIIPNAPAPATYYPIGVFK